MDMNKLRELYAAKINAAKAKATEWEGKENEMPQKVADEINRILGEADEVKVKLTLAQQLNEGSAFLEEPAGTKAAHLGWREAGPGEGDVPVDPQAWREVEFETPTGRKSLRFHVPLAVQAKGYASAFEGYLRKGFQDLGPNDRKTLTEGVDSAGGFLVPEDYHTELIKKVATNAIIRQYARVITTSRDLVKWPKVNYTTDDKYTSGVRLTWTGESPASATTHRVTDPVFGLITIPVHTAMASMPLSNDLLEDAAFDVIGMSSDLMAEAFALGEEDAFINGNGVARPMGILTQVDGDGPVSVVSGSASALTADGIVDLVYALPAQYERNARILMNKATEKAIRKLKDDNSNYLWPVWPQQGGFAAAPRELLGFPVMRDEFVPDITANDYPIIFGDLNGYFIVDRVGFSVQRLRELYAETNITLLLARKRVGGYVTQPWRLRVQKVSA